MFFTDEDLEELKRHVRPTRGNPNGWSHVNDTLLLRDRPPAAPVKRPKKAKPAKPQPKSPGDSTQVIDT